MIELEDVVAAAARLTGVAHRTPVLRSRMLDGRVGGDVFLKVESFQRTGTFKFRGAYNTIASLDAADRARGVGAFSSGNHAQAVALAAALFNIPAVILMPEDTPAAKLAATRGYGGEIVTYDRYGGDREALGRAMVAGRGLTLVPPYEHPMVMAGQGTVALELFDEVGGLDVLVVPVGGGGLIAGCSTVAKAQEFGVRVVGVEPESGDDTRQSLAAGERVRIVVPRTIADGQQADIPGELTFGVNRRRVDEIAVVSDDEIIEAMRFLFDRLKLVTEPSGASAVAAVLAGRVDRLTGQRVGVVISGGNVGVDRFRELTSIGYHSVTPRVVVDDVDSQVSFLRAVFDAHGSVVPGRPVELRIGDSFVLITAASPERQPFPAFLYIYVDDVDSRYGRALAAGAVPIEAPADTPYGDRRAMVRDPFGNLLQIAVARRNRS